MPAVNALLVDMSSGDSIVEGFLAGTAIGAGLGIYFRLNRDKIDCKRFNIKERDIRPSKWEDVGSITTLSLVFGMIGGSIDYASKAF